MKNIYLLMFVGIIAVVLVAVNIMNFNPKMESWSSVLLGAAVGVLIVKGPAIIAYFKNKRKASK